MVNGHLWNQLPDELRTFSKTGHFKRRARCWEEQNVKIDVLVFLFHESPKNYVHNIIIVLRWDGSIHVIYLLVWVDTP